MGFKGEVSKYHPHKDGTKGWDVNIKKNDGYGKTVHKMHVSDQGNVGESGGGLISGIAKTAGSIFGSLFGSKDDERPW